MPSHCSNSYHPLPLHSQTKQAHAPTNTVTLIKKYHIAHLHPKTHTQTHSCTVIHYLLLSLLTCIGEAASGWTLCTTQTDHYSKHMASATNKIFIENKQTLTPSRVTVCPNSISQGQSQTIRNCTDLLICCINNYILRAKEDNAFNLSRNLW